MGKIAGICDFNNLNANEHFKSDDCNYISSGVCSLADFTKEPYCFNFENNRYYIISLGKIFNSKEIEKDLISNGFEITENLDSEIILKSYILYGNYAFSKFNGSFSFAIWDEQNRELIIARDHMGIKPFYYCLTDNSLYFSSSLDYLIEFSKIELTLDKQGISELFGIGPAHTPGTCLFKNIFELRPANFGIFNKYGLHIDKYWGLKNREHTDDLDTTCSKISYILEDSINSQLPRDEKFCTMLSGGLDSSIITAYASKFCARNNLPNLKTISVDYIDNDKNFVKNDFQPNSDNYYIDIMRKTFNTNHKVFMIDTPELFNSLKEAMEARGLPGMADIDSSLLLFCKNIKKECNIAISGECSDEVFSGYPWFFREDALNSGTFPWSLALKERQEILKKDIVSKINIKEYVDFRYSESINELNYSLLDSKDTTLRKKISYLTYSWFMQTLVDRAERIANMVDLDVRIPFCDYRLVEYLWNIPWDMKAYKGREKGLLRYIVKDLLPKEIVERKKSPYPKTYNPTYLNAVKKVLVGILNNTNSPILNLIDKDFVLKIIETDGKSFVRPWFGQLMTGPQLMAYLAQINMWLEKYKPRIEI